MVPGRVSIIIPCYNMQEFLAESIESALAQTYKDFEVVFVNDGSTDGSLAIAQSFGDRIKIVDQANTGLPGARNAGVAASTGEFILPLDSDDKIDPEYLSKTVPKMSDPAVGIVSSYMEVFGIRSGLHGAPGTPYPIFHPTREQILTGNCILVASLIRRTAFDEAGGYPQEMTGGSEDWCLWAGIICLGKYRVEVVPEHLFKYRTRPHSMSSTMVPFEEARQKIRDIYGFPDPKPVDRKDSVPNGTDYDRIVSGERARLSPLQLWRRGEGAGWSSRQGR